MLPYQLVILEVRAQHRLAYDISSTYQPQAVPTDELVLLVKENRTSHYLRENCSVLLLLVAVQYPHYIL